MLQKKAVVHMLCVSYPSIRLEKMKKTSNNLWIISNWVEVET
jgi:hypothetical protein